MHMRRRGIVKFYTPKRIFYTPLPIFGRDFDENIEKQALLWLIC